MEYLINKQRIEFYNKFPHSIEDKIINLFGEVCFYNGTRKGGSMESKISPLKYKSPLHPKNVDPRNINQVIRCIKDEIAYAKFLETSSSSPYNSPIVSRTHKEP